MAALGAAAALGDVRGLHQQQRAAASRCVSLTVAKESRVGKQPVPVPKGVTVKVESGLVTAKARPGGGCCLARR